MTHSSTSIATAPTGTGVPKATPPVAATSRPLVLALILVGQLMLMLDLTIVNVALPDISAALSFSPSQLSWVLSAYTLTFGGLLLLGARAGDLLGRRRTFIAGVAVFTAASLAGGLVTDGPLLLAARALQGVGAALAAPATLSLLTSTYADGRDRTRALGLYSAVSVGGAAVGLVAGGMLTSWVSWRWVFFVNVPVGIALIVLAVAVLPREPARRGHFDLAGAVTSTAGMTAIVYGFVRAAEAGWSDGLTLAAFGVGLLLLVAFGYVERTAAVPVTPLSLFADRTRSGSYLARLLLIASITGMFFFLTLFLQGILGLSALQTGLGFLPLSVALFVTSQASARDLVQRFGGRSVMVAGLAVSSLGLLWLTQLSGASGYVDVLGPMLALGIGNGAAIVPLTAASLTGVPAEHAGSASGLVNAVQQVGGSVGLAVLITVFGSAGGTEGAPGTDPAGFVTAAQTVFGTSALLLVLAAVVVAVTSPRRPRAAAPPVPGA